MALWVNFVARRQIGGARGNNQPYGFVQETRGCLDCLGSGCTTGRGQPVDHHVKGCLIDLCSYPDSFGAGLLGRRGDVVRERQAGYPPTYGGSHIANDVGSFATNLGLGLMKQLDAKNESSNKHVHTRRSFSLFRLQFRSDSALPRLTRATAAA
jgi:hypothetical protein